MSAPAPPQPAAEQAAPAAPSRAVGDAAARIQEIIDTAERVAGEIRGDAELEAERYLESERARASGLHEAHAGLLIELADEMTNQAEAVRAQIEASVDALHAAAARIREAASERPPAPADLGSAAQPAPVGEEAVSSVVEEPEFAEPVASEAEDTPTPEPQTALVEEPSEPAPPAPEAGSADSGSEEAALLRATQMAVAGSERSEIATTLRDEMGIEDPNPILDEILGPSS